MDVKQLLKKFVEYQIEWLTMHDDVEFEPENEQLIIKFLKDTEKCFMLENKALPPVKPEQKIGAWVGIDEEPHECFECNNCGNIMCAIYDINDYKYCPECGAKMQEAKE